MRAIAAGLLLALGLPSPAWATGTLRVIQRETVGAQEELARAVGHPSSTGVDASGLEERATLERYRDAFLVPGLELDATGLRVKDNRSGLTAFVQAADGRRFEGFIPKGQTSSYQRDLQYLVQRQSCPVAVTNAQVVTGDPPKLHLTFTVLDEPMRARRAILNTVPPGSVVRATIQSADPNGLYGTYDGVNLFVPLSTVTPVVGRKPFDEWRDRAIEGVVQEIDWARGRLTLTFTRLAPLESSSTASAAVSAAPPGMPTLHRLVKAHRILSGADPHGFEAMVTSASASGWPEPALGTLFRAGRTFLTDNPGYPVEGLVENLRIGIIELDLSLDQMLELLREATNVDHTASPDYDAGDDHLSVTLFQRQQRLTAAETGLEELEPDAQRPTMRLPKDYEKGYDHPLLGIQDVMEELHGLLQDVVFGYPPSPETLQYVRTVVLLHQYATALMEHLVGDPNHPMTIEQARYFRDILVGELAGFHRRRESGFVTLSAEDVELVFEGALTEALPLEAHPAIWEALRVVPFEAVVLPPFSARGGLEERLRRAEAAAPRSSDQRLRPEEASLRPLGQPPLTARAGAMDLQGRVRALTWLWEEAFQKGSELETWHALVLMKSGEGAREAVDALQAEYETFKERRAEVRQARPGGIFVNATASDIDRFTDDELAEVYASQALLATQLLPVAQLIATLASQIPAGEAWHDQRTHLIEAANALARTVAAMQDYVAETAEERLTARPRTEKSGDVLVGSTAVLAPVYARGNLPYAVIVATTGHAAILKELEVPADHTFVQEVLGETEARDAADAFLRGLGVTQVQDPSPLLVGVDAVQARLLELFTSTFELPSPTLQQHLRDLVLQAQHAFEA